jgi:CubicO group peptidase (beta-lactamase class C family)
MQIQGYCEDQFLEVKNLFKSFFNNQIEIGSNLALIKNGKVLINLYSGTKNKNQDPWDENTLTNTFSLSKGIYAGCVAKLINWNEIDIEKNIYFYWPSFKKNNKQNIKVKHLLSHQSGLYRFKSLINNQDLLDWDKIIYLIENQEPDHASGEATFYHAKTHGFIVGELIKKITNLNLNDFFYNHIGKPYEINFHFGVKDKNLNNISDLVETENNNKTIENNEFDAFNNPKHDVQFYNSLEWRKSLVPSMGGHGNAFAVAKYYDILSNDIKNSYNKIISKNIFKTILEQSTTQKDGSLGIPIRWTYSGFILRGGWMFGKNKESFGHNGWGGSLGFGDPVEGFGLAYITRKVNSGMGADTRAVQLVKKIYDCLI